MTPRGGMKLGWNKGQEWGEMRVNENEFNQMIYCISYTVRCLFDPEEFVEEVY